MSLEKDYWKKYYQEHKESCNKSSHKYYQCNREKILKQKKQYDKNKHRLGQNKCIDCNIIIDDRSIRCYKCSSNFKKKGGENSPRWKGGKTTNQGYTVVYTQGHPYGKNKNRKVSYVFEHRLVMEAQLRKTNPRHPALIEIAGQRYLRPKYVVHHKNQKRSDNRIENLELWSRTHPIGHKVCTCCGGFDN